jgi:hypothetical protein
LHSSLSPQHPWLPCDFFLGSVFHQPHLSPSCFSYDIISTSPHSRSACCSP